MTLSRKKISLTIDFAFVRALRLRVKLALQVLSNQNSRDSHDPYRDGQKRDRPIVLTNIDE